MGWESALSLAAVLAIVGALLWLGIAIDPDESKHDAPEVGFSQSAESLTMERLTFTI